jgi:peptidoglycan biosynthesis protein MviN/MurJ (putative lipid II flippase)
METADINNNRSFHELKKSLLIRVPTINIISNAFYIIGVTIASLAFSLINSLIIYIIILSLIYIISQTFNTYILWHMLSKKVKIKLNHQPIIKYLIASIIMGIVLFYAKKIIKFTSVYETAPEVLITIGIGAITYIIILYAISKEFRSLTKVTINEIRQSLHK